MGDLLLLGVQGGGILTRGGVENRGKRKERGTTTYGERGLTVVQEMYIFSFTLN